MTNTEPLTLATARTPQEREAVIEEIRDIATQLRDVLKDAPAFSEDDLYDEDGLPAGSSETDFSATDVKIAFHRD